ncbi:SNARE domain-containing protein [Echria macrotheca]|uniref:t-SNARE affecting a late Golgi compartment protein 1 n=1 Tax=Echria macrotheca TaxID=438768 RepID=A0AAJ0FFZ8_9PEZI|nr:SNARE domain-containing protein [Echria macrotheca]
MMSSNHEEDPFLQVQQDVLTQLQSARPLFTSYLRIRSLATSAASPELASARADLEAALSSLAEDLADLVESVRAVESNPAQFGLSQTEVTRRKRLVQEVGGEVDDMRGELASQISSSSNKKKGGQNDNDHDHLPDPSSFAIGGGDGDVNGDGGDEDYAAEFEHQQQEMMMQEQDRQLDGVFQTVGNLRRQADDMGRELEEQREMLEVVDNLADRVGGRLQTGMEKLRYVMRRNEDRLSSCCIGVLILVLIILLILLLVI